MSKLLAGRVDLDLAIAADRDLEAERCDVAECREGQGRGIARAFAHHHGLLFRAPNGLKAEVWQQKYGRPRLAIN
jgi:hypothetical protein